MADAPIAPFSLTGTFVPVTVDSLPPPDNTVPGDVVARSLTINSGDEDPSRLIYAQVTMYQPTYDHAGDGGAFERAMHEHSPPLERHMVPIGNHYEVAYMTHDDWNKYQEAYTQMLARQEEVVRGHSIMADLGIAPPSNPLFRGPAFNSVMFVRDFDVPSLAIGHLRRETRQIMGADGVTFDTQGFIATNDAAAEFLRGRGYVEVERVSEGGRSHPLFLPPLDAQLYRQTATI